MNMNYDENIKKAEAIIQQLEASEAISMDEYKRLAAEATALLKECKAAIDDMSSSISPTE